jgi:two-component system LytT family sensor kinase
MNLLINLIFLILVLRLSFEKRVMHFLVNGRWPGLIIIQHILFWLIFISISGYVYYDLFGFQQATLRLVFMLGINIPVYLLCFRVLVPAYYQPKRYGEYVRYTAAIFVISSLLRILIEPELFKTGADGRYLFVIYLMQTIIILVPSIQGISKYKLIAERELAALGIRKKEADLELLKSKINPHFLFNTLNNIYSHSYTKDESSANLIKQLSLLMQYTTYEISKSTIPVDRELQMITALSSLYQLKSNSGLNIILDFESDELFDIIEIPPTIYLTLFENAIKYAAMGQDKTAKIEASVKVTETNLQFCIENSISEKTIAIDNTSYRGVGIKVLENILENHYGSNYTLENRSEGKNYKSMLTIYL